MRRILGSFGMLALLANLTLSTHALAEPDVKYPIMFNQMSDLETLGLSLQWPTLYDTGIQNAALPKPGLPIGCYVYAGGGTRALISISEDFLARYKAKGFSRESLCMGLASRMRFDPETGKRLPTYMFRDDKVMDAALAKLDPANMSEEALASFVPDFFKSRDDLAAGLAKAQQKNFAGMTNEQIEILMQTDDGFISDELPLKVPDCFKNGTPYLDCNWRYGLMTGKKLSAIAPQRYRDVGKTIDAHMQNLVKYRTWDTIDAGPYLQKRVWGLIMDWSGDLPDSIWKYWPTSGLSTAEHQEGLYGVASINNGQALEFNVGNSLHAWADEVTWFDVSPSFPRGYGYNLTSIDDGFGDGGASAQSILAAYDGASSSGRFSAARLQALLN
jgi:hypothetical protein